MTGTFHIVVAMKPLDGNFSENAIKYGVAGLNIDECRVGTESVNTHSRGKNTVFPKRPCEKAVEESGRKTRQDIIDPSERNGRFPANVIHDGSEMVMELFPKAGGGFGSENRAEGQGRYGKFSGATKGKIVGYGDSGSAARFFKVCGEYKEVER